MRNSSFSVILISTLFSCADLDLSRSSSSCSDANQISNYDRAEELQAIMDKYTAQGVTGVGIAVKTSTQLWEGASGYAKIEDNTKMRPCHLQYSQSVAKTYTAVLVMMLYEENKINLDASIKNYLPASIGSKIRKSDRITVRMLLNHTSGIYDYVSSIPYITDQLSNIDKIYDYHEFLEYAYGRDPIFEPGSKYSYSNTNYVLLAVMVNEITGKDHSVMMTERIFQHAGLNHTFYKNEKGYLQYPELVNSYWNRRSDERLENISDAQIKNVYTMIGDDGIVATPLDYVRFLSALVNGQLLKAETVDVMRQWVNGKEGKPAYGLGLGFGIENGIEGYGHSGAGIGAGCILRYFPSKDIHVFMGVNTSTFFDGPYTDKILKMKEELMAVILR
jgi:D-alanyl-D-alanine carboxypeptidase